MIYLYPANKMEHLLQLYLKIQQLEPLPIFEKETLVVQNAGMQHWLSMSLANSRKISFNFSYALPAQFLWKLARTVAGEENVPDETLFSREVLSWRILALLMSDEVINDEDFDQVTQFWRGENVERLQQQRCYQLACQLADLFEQYLIYRPKWIAAWNKGDLSCQQDEQISLTDANQQLMRWQAKLWRLLTREVTYDPQVIIKHAIANLGQNSDKLPKRIAFFGINAMAPMWLDFINAISEHCQVHFFHLNPCADYWGDIQTEKHAFKHIDQWLSQDELSALSTNPLLANLGQQGKEFLSLLQNYSTINIDAFDDVEETKDIAEQSVLSLIQRDILTLTDARQQQQTVKDHSITITRAHSAMREIQGLHDWLLHQFNQDPSLTPKDVLVMCPEVEHYAPYVNAVFARGWQELSDDVPPLPCSIADRVSKNAEPVVAAFIDLLRLPDSRFQVSQILGFLRVEQVKTKFELDDDDLEKIAQWLEIACVHWGRDSQHKADVLNLTQASESFTWQQGLARLVRGFAYQDEDVIWHEQLLLSNVEGSEALLLGKLMLIVSLLEQHTKQLSQAKPAQLWVSYLHQFVDDFFLEQDSQKLLILKDAINLFADYTDAAGYDALISLGVVQHFLNNHFSVPDPGRQFMIGQVTFCSMVPMRSIPFKIIAVLGLNDGQFPRQRQPLSYDLMAQTPFMLGDRSRRGDDRYMFLEALVSARQALYLSYQGNSLKNNAVQQPSIVLKELMDYLAHGYGWDVFDSADDIRKLPMQPFSVENYQGEFASFDKNWLALGMEQPKAQDSKAQNLPISTDTLSLDITELVRFFDHPAKYFARHHLNLYLTDNNTVLDDVEPFAVSRLDAYQYRELLLDAYLSGEAVDTDAVAQQLYQQQKLSGRLPDLPTTRLEVNQWQQDVDDFYQMLQSLGIDQASDLALEYQTQITLQDGQTISVQLTGTAQVIDKLCVVYRQSEPKAKDMLLMVLSQLLLQAGQTSHHGELCNIGEVTTKGIYFNTKSQRIDSFDCQHIPEPNALLDGLIEIFLLGQQQALLVNLALAERINKAKEFTQQVFEEFWCDSNLFKPFSEDEYMQYVWPETPLIEAIPEQIQLVCDCLSLAAKQRKARGKK
ncbi:exodeoxyribonuclease V subunit gamma [Thalassotalea sp. LPB0316]|uniref:exodeoxyribonuclease V subunit gamma n=1 Tax=Thalassotalea sp. LPB0316 TaxID=2769490 RepID=UPI0018675A9A|nr:exodeoxyribonuclease V subunit gamma [Thalassotalea sp. LPB0316]QOL24947.1 exodeoxyribonuclease V subunit gamma [Thalassotalea sp. LPB0316]